MRLKTISEIEVLQAAAIFIRSQLHKEIDYNSYHVAEYGLDSKESQERQRKYLDQINELENEIMRLEDEIDKYNKDQLETQSREYTCGMCCEYDCNYCEYSEEEIEDE